jgi:hypothetical protein
MIVMTDTNIFIKNTNVQFMMIDVSFIVSKLGHEFIT